MVDRGMADDERGRLQIAQHGRLGPHDRSIPDLQVPGDAGLTGQDHRSTELRASGDTRLRHEDRSVPHLHVVPDLHQVVEA
jgi:hypothetical protein